MRSPSLPPPSFTTLIPYRLPLCQCTQMLVVIFAILLKPRKRDLGHTLEVGRWSWFMVGWLMRLPQSESVATSCYLPLLPHHK